MKKNICILVLTAGILLFLSGCGKHMAAQLQLADSLSNKHPQKALELVQRLETHALLTEDERMRMELIKAKSQVLSGIPFTTDSVVRRVAAYYHQYGTPGEKFASRYIVACAAHDLKDDREELIWCVGAIELTHGSVNGPDYALLAHALAHFSELSLMHSNANAANCEMSLNKAAIYSLKNGDRKKFLDYRKKAKEAWTLAVNTPYTEYPDTLSPNKANLVSFHDMVDMPVYRRANNWTTTGCLAGGGIALLLVAYAVRRRYKQKHIAPLSSPLPKEAFSPTDRLQQTDIVQHFHHLANENKCPSEAEWEQLAAAFNQLLPLFLPEIYKRSPHIHKQDTHTCMLVRLYFRPTELSILLACSKPTVTYYRRQLDKKLFNGIGKADAFDTHIRQL